MRNTATRVLLTYAAIGVVCGLANIPNAYLFNLLSVTVPWLLGLATALYLLPGMLGLALAHRPGAGLFTLLFAGLVQLPFVPTGIASLSVFVILGVLVEIPFAIRRYRRWTTGVFLAAAILVPVVYSGFWIAAFITPVMPLWQIVLIPIVLTVTALATTWFALFIADRVARTGVLRGVRPARTETTDPAPA